MDKLYYRLWMYPSINWRSDTSLTYILLFAFKLFVDNTVGGEFTRNLHAALFSLKLSFKLALL